MYFTVCFTNKILTKPTFFQNPNAARVLKMPSFDWSKRLALNAIKNASFTYVSVKCRHKTDETITRIDKVNAKREVQRNTKVRPGL